MFGITRQKERKEERFQIVFAVFRAVNEIRVYYTEDTACDASPLFFYNLVRSNDVFVYSPETRGATKG